MIQVQIEGVGIVEFPDNTPEEIIDKAIKRDYFPEKLEAKKPTFMGKYLPSVKRTGEIYNQEVSQGAQAMSKMLENPTGRNIIGGVLGAGQYLLSPLTAGAKGLVGEPEEQWLNTLGFPESVSKFGGSLAENAAYMIPYGSLVKQAMNVPKVISGGMKTTETLIPKITEKVPKEALKFPEEMNPNIISEVTTPISQTQKAILREDVVGDVIKAVKEPVSLTWEATGKKRITQEVVDYLMQNKAQIPATLEKYQLSGEQFAAHIKETMSTSGRQLGQMGNWAKEISKQFQTPQMKQLAEFMEKDLPEMPLMDTVANVAKKIENVRRATLVSQTATTVRNAISQFKRLTLDSVDSAFQGAMKGALGEKGFVVGNKQGIMSTLRGFGEGLDTWTATINRFKPKEREALTNLLEADNAIKAKSKIFTTPVQDVVLTQKVTKLLNTFNTAQEYFFRNIAFEAKLNQLLKSAGVKGGIKGVKPTDIPEEMFNKAADHSLEMTFTAMPKSKFGRDWVKMNTNPVMTALLNPFPRFLWGNALPFLKNFSPISFLEAINPKTVAEIASGNPEKFAKAISRATLGTIMLNTAIKIRSDPNLGGEKWYEIKVGNRRLDTRAFAPFSSYLFLAESMTNPENIKPADFASALLSLNRIGGTGLILTDIIRGKKAETVVNTLSRLGGEYLGSFSTPFRTIKDLYSAIDPEEAKIRDVREKELVGPTMRNIPGISQTLPVAVSPLQRKEIETETPVLRQLTGLSLKNKTAIQKEIDTLNLDSSAYMPRSGIPEADREISRYMGPMVEDNVGKLLSSPFYKNQKEPTKRLLLGLFFKEMKEQARNELIKNKPDLAIKVQIKRQPEDIKTILGLPNQ